MARDEAMPAIAVGWLALAAGVGCAAWLMRQSTGAPLDDEIGHYLVARDAWHDPRLLLNLWGRSLNTLIYTVPAGLGLTATRWFSIGLTAVTVWFAYRLARHLSLRHAYLVVPFAWFQRWTLELSHTCLTEIPFMLFLTAGLERFAAGRLLTSSLLLGSLPLIRHEGIALVGLWGVCAVFMRQWRMLPTLVLPCALYNLVYFVVAGAWPFAIFFEAKPTDEYGSGGWTHFAPLIREFAGRPVLLLALAGLPRMLRTRDRCLVTLTFVVYLLVHVVIFRFGLFASGGYVEFLLPLAPGFAVAAAAAVDWIGAWGVSSGVAPSRGRRVDDLLRAAAIAGMIAAVVVVGVRGSRPVALRPIERACIQAASWLRGQRLNHRPIVATNVWFYHALPLRVTDPAGLWEKPDGVERTPVGGIVVWDSKYSELWGVRLAALTADRGRWRRRAVFGRGPEVIVFERMK